MCATWDHSWLHASFDSACKSVPRFCFSTVWDWSVDYFLDYSICCFAHNMSKKKKKSPRWLRRMSLVSSATRRSLETRTGALVLLRITPKIEKSHPTWYQIKQKKAHRCPKSHLPPVVQHDTLLFFAGPCRYICSERCRADVLHVSRLQRAAPADTRAAELRAVQFVYLQGGECVYNWLPLMEACGR